MGGHARRGSAVHPHVPHPALLDALAELRGQGFRISGDGVGDGNVPLRFLVDMSPDLVKLDASLLARAAAARALCDEFGVLLAWRA